MNYSLAPFPTDPKLERNSIGPRPDIRRAIASRPRPTAKGAIANADLLEVAVDALRDVTAPFFVTHCHEGDRDLHVSIAAAGKGYCVTVGDELRGGLMIRNSESRRFATLISTRLYRVVCANGLLVEFEQEQSFCVATGDMPPVDWQVQVRQVIRRSFDDNALKFDFRRFEATADQMLVTPYEFLCNLVAQQVITEDEQAEIQANFDENADFTMYGLINAVTQTAHAHRASDQWVRAFQIERLAGEILRGDHNLPAFDLVSSRGR
jgi:hypothetical protein